MESYRYEGRNTGGEPVAGQIEAVSAQAVAEWMLSAGLVPVRIQRQAPAAGAVPWWRALGPGARPGTAELMLFTRQFGIMVRAGVPILQALAGIQKSSAHPRMVELLRTLREDLDRGLDLSGAMARHPRFFGDYYVSMIRVGETSGRLEEVLAGLHAQLEFEKDMRRKIKSALRYPGFVVAALVIAMTVLNIFVIPVFARVYAGMKVDLPPLTRLLIGVSDFAVGWWWAIAAGAVAGAFVLRAALATPAGRLAWDRRKLGLPVFGGILAQAAMARLCRSLATAMRSGVPIDRAFSLVAPVVDNAWYAGKVLNMREAVGRGESILRTAQSAGIFKPLELQMIAVGEETGALEEMLGQIADLYQDEVEYEVARIGDSIEPILLAAIGGMVLVLMLGIFMPLWDLGQMAR